MDQPHDLRPDKRKTATVDSSASETESRQSLLSRSRRILGESVELGQAPRIDRSGGGTSWNPPRKASTLPLPKPAGITDTPLESDQSANHDGLDKRREQVRQAQRTHRQRTQTYIRTLEKEVLRLRNCESAALARVSTLEKQVTALLAILVENRIALPSQYSDAPCLEPEPAVNGGQVLLNPNSGEEPLVSVNWQASPQFSTGTNSSTTASTWGEEDVPLQSHPPIQELQGHVISPPSDSTARSTTPTTPSLLQDPRVGIGFVLELERPCLSHLRDSPLDHQDSDPYINGHPDGISGHLFTASLSFWQPTVPSRSSPSSYSISQQELDRLLQTSLNIGVSGDEITPVQLWHQLQRLFDKYGVGGPDAAVLGRLVTELRKHVECLHYGAVMDLRIVSSILGDFFPALSTAWQGLVMRSM